MPDGTPTLHVVIDPLKSIYVYADELQDSARKAIKNKQGGTVTFVTQSNAKVTARLTRVWFPEGTWSVVVGQNQLVDSFKPLFPKDVPQAVLQSLSTHTGTADPLIGWLQNADQGKAIKAILDGSVGRSVLVIVSYSRVTGGNAQSLPDRLPLTAQDISPLADEELADLYLQFVQHFGGVDVDFTLAQGGLTRAELDQVEQNRPERIAITDLFLQGFAEFQAARGAAQPPVNLENFQAMEESIFFQRQVKNALAQRNMLAIGMGSLLFTTDNGDKDLKDDIGVLRRTVNGGNRLLLYDRFGNAVRGVIGGFLDSEFRSTDLQKVRRDSKIPTLDITVSDPALYAFLRSLEQELGHPVREIEALVASLYKYSIFITDEIHARYNGEIEKRLLACAPAVIGFFVAHAFVSYLTTVQPAVGVPLMLLLKGAGMVLGFDALLLDMSLMTQAGRHFTQMEQLHRDAQGNGKPELTALSNRHLQAGAAALLDAMADFIALGVLIAGGFAAGKFGPALARGAASAAKRSSITIRNNVIVAIRALKAMTEVKTASPKVDETPAGLASPAKPEVPQTKAVDHPDAYKGEPAKGTQPKLKNVVVKRPKALDETPDQFASDAAAQQELFDAAKAASDRQKAFIDKILAQLKITNADAKSIRKREVLSEFVRTILEKVKGRKNYKTIGEMNDIIRGRINLDDPADVKRLFDALMTQREASHGKFTFPDGRVGVDNGYPRFHIDVIDPETGIPHEWQIGTKQTTDLFERPGIDPAGTNIQPANTNIHDIEYDIFKSIDEPSAKRTPAEQAEFRQLADELGIRAFRKKVAELAARTGTEKVPSPEFEQALKALHAEASGIMRALVNKKGKAFTESFLH